MTRQWITDRLAMGIAGYISHLTAKTKAGLEIRMQVMDSGDTPDSIARKMEIVRAQLSGGHIPVMATWPGCKPNKNRASNVNVEEWKWDGLK